MHGSIGFTWRHQTSVYYRRALGLAAAFGRAADYPLRVVDTATTTGVRKLDLDLDPETEKIRKEIRAEVDALKEIPANQRMDAIVEGGWVMPYLPKPWGLGHPGRADHHRTGIQRRQRPAPMLGIASFLSRPLSRSAMKSRNNAFCRRRYAVK